ncbi:MAG: endonuclease domain-containing protein [Lysobacteraceae bacterium]|nr:MAG: endonuclease domain-containing protein [Xanthomonadaceae bacterium]
MSPLTHPREARAFRFVRRDHADGVVSLVYAFDDGPELVERIVFPAASALVPARMRAFEAALDLLHLVAGVSYYKAAVPAQILVESTRLDAATAGFLDALYLHGLGEFAYHNRLDLRGRIRFPVAADAPGAPAPALGLAHRTLVPIGGGKDSLVSVEVLKRAGAAATATWVGHSPLIAACAERTRLPLLNIRRELSPLLFEYNKAGAYNGHIPVTAINSAILVVAALLHDHDAIAFSNERSASSATLEYEGQAVNHQWSKGWEFEQRFRERVHARVAADLAYYSLLRPLSELAVAERFARSDRYDDVFSSCNRNFRILGPRPADRWCGQCPKCHFVFLALAPFMPKPRLLGIFGRNLLDDAALAAAFDALMEYRDHKPFECVGEGIESRAAMAALVERAEWREDALVARFADEILPQLERSGLALATQLAPGGEHAIPAGLLAALDADR